MSAWQKLDPESYPRDRMILVRSKRVPIGPANLKDGFSYAIAQAGQGSRLGLWALNAFWPDEPLKEENGISSTLWDEWAEMPS